MTAMRRAAVFNNSMYIRGGGERSTLVFALALKRLGFQVEVLSQMPLPDTADITRYFGPEFADITTRHIFLKEKEDIHDYLKDSGLDVFVNHNHGDLPRNPAPFGVYAQMFPTLRVSRWRTLRRYRNLQSYQLLVNNSAFTKRYTDKWWDFPRKRSEILYPPIAALFHERRAALLAERAPRKKQILNIGRFSKIQWLHTKNQTLLLDAFVEARTRFPELADWSLVLVGPIMHDSAEYVAALAQRIKELGAAVTLQHNVDSSQLSNLMSESSMYVHTTGAFYSKDRDAFRCEHFGLSIAEAMSHGCIPLVYDRGGILEVLKSGDFGFTYRSRAELVEGIRKIALLHENDSLADLRVRNIQAVAHLNISEFTAAFQALLEKHGLPAQRTA
jgi:glycosyltransferase involved in cell wall biosynthesis